MSMYDGMLPKEYDKGKIGYYPVMNKAEWDELPDLYKAMEWSAMPDPFDKEKRMRAVKSVIFDVVYMEPYGIRAQVSVHPQEVQKLLFCNYGETQCHLYSISSVELEGGTKLPAKWLQDSTTGAFAVLANHNYIARQGGFGGHVPECIERLDDGTFKWKGFGNYSKTNHYEISSPFRDLKPEKNIEKDAVEKLMDAVAEYGLENSWSDNDIIDTLVDCGVTFEDFKNAGKEDFVREYFEEEEKTSEIACGYVCKCCGEVIVIDEDDPEWFDLAGEEDLWGHIQMAHEDIFEECQDWETATMLEEYFDRIVDGEIVDRDDIRKDKEKKNNIIQHAMAVALKDGYDQLVICDKNGEYSFTRSAQGMPVVHLCPDEKVIGKVTYKWINGCPKVSYEDVKSLEEKMAGAKEMISDKKERYRAVSLAELERPAEEHEVKYEPVALAQLVKKENLNKNFEEFDKAMGIENSKKKTDVEKKEKIMTQSNGWGR